MIIQDTNGFWATNSDVDEMGKFGPYWTIILNTYYEGRYIRQTVLRHTGGLDALLNKVCYWNAMYPDKWLYVPISFSNPQGNSRR
jgi:hypothetical protein